MLHRAHPKKIRNVSQESPVKAVRLSPQAAASLKKLGQAIVAKWGKDQAPSISMMISKALNAYADKITYSPARLEAAYAEFVEEATTRKE